MKITAQGWKRDSGPKTICDVEVSDGKPKTGTGYSPDVLYVENTSKGVILSVGPTTLTLGGQYQLKVAMTREDIARLFLETHPELRATFAPILG